jgi:hypothetical protein
MPATVEEDASLVELAAAMDLFCVHLSKIWSIYRSFFRYFFCAHLSELWSLNDSSEGAGDAALDHARDFARGRVARRAGCRHRLVLCPSILRPSIKISTGFFCVRLNDSRESRRRGTRSCPRLCAGTPRSSSSLPPSTFGVHLSEDFGVHLSRPCMIRPVKVQTSAGDAALDYARDREGGRLARRARCRHGLPLLPLRPGMGVYPRRSSASIYSKSNVLECSRTVNTSYGHIRQSSRGRVARRARCDGLPLQPLRPCMEFPF